MTLLCLHGYADGLRLICLQQEGQVPQDYGVFLIVFNTKLLFLVYALF